VPSLILVSVGLFVAACVGVDLRARRIPNGLSMTGIAAGIALNGLCFGPRGVGASLAGCVLVVGLLLAPFAAGGIGGGDVKMMAALGALLGPRLGVASLLVGMILGGIVMAVHLARRGELGVRTVRIATMVHAAAVTGSIEPLRVSATAADTIALPYSIPLGLGTLVVSALAVTGGPW